MVSTTISEMLCCDNRGFFDELDVEEEVFSNWAREQEKLLLETVSQQQEVASQITELQRHAALQQMEFQAVLERVSQLSGKPPKSKERSVHPWTDEGQVTEALSVQVEETSQKFLARCVDHTIFNAVSTCVICLNAIFIGVSVQYAVDHPHNPSTFAMQGVEYVFLCYYMVEFAIQMLVAEGLCVFFRDSWNVFDGSLVIAGCFDVVSDLAGVSTADVAVVKVIRLLKMSKLLRVVRVMRLFKELRLTFHVIAVSCRSLVWAVLMLALIMYIFNLAFVHAATTYLAGDSLDDSIVDALDLHWSSVLQAMKSLFLAITGGNDWSEYVRSVEPTGAIYYWLFLFYIVFMALLVLNILTGFFVEHSVDAAQRDRDVVLLALLDNTDGMVQEIRKMFKRFDTVGEVLTVESFREILKHKQVRDMFKILEIDTSESQQLFDELDVSQDGNVDFDEFTSGLLKLKGSAKSVDMVLLGADMKNYTHQQAFFIECVDHKFGLFQQALEDMCGGSVLFKGDVRS